MSAPSVRRRLVGLARSKLGSYGSHAEDVVSRVLIKWTFIPAEKASVARIEQVVKSEALSLLRSESRLKHREARVASDPTTPTRRSVSHSAEHEHEFIALRIALATTCKREHIGITPTDIEVLELLLAGHTLASTARAMGITSYEVKRSRARWQHVYSRTFSEPTTDAAPYRTQPA